MGGGTRKLITNIIELKSAAMISRFAFCTETPLFTYEAYFSLKKLNAKMQNEASESFTRRAKKVFLVFNGRYKLTSYNTK